ncbi:hypothetical protein IFO70_18135 [Phormidium tenue FACHB-886]|nr:hypothetical protein [Phormidium tenue FACHB-886]
MPKSIANLTMLVVCAEIEQITDTHYHYPYPYIFAHSDLRQELIAYVLTRVRNVHITVEQEKEADINAETTPCPTEIKLQIEDLIHQGVHYVLQKYGNSLSSCVLQEDYSYSIASYGSG